MDDAALQARLDQLAAQAGGNEALSAWETAQGYDDAGFRAALKVAAAAAWMRDRISAGVPEAVEQVHARQILLYNEGQANDVLSQIESGADFATLAEDYDPVAGGDLGWFPQGYLTEPELEQAAFKLQPGEHSQVIHTRLGYHILELIERDPQRPLEPDARLALQNNAVKQWLAQRRSQSDIKILTQ
jgi:parvulin-like peptidyl-prolyl isomerase